MRIITKGPLILGVFSLTCLINGCGQNTASPGKPPAVRTTAKAPHTTPDASRGNTSHVSSTAVKTLPPIMALNWSSSTVGYLAASSTVYRTATGGHSWSPWYHSHHVITSLTTTPKTVWITTSQSLLEILRANTGQREHSVTLPVKGVPQTITVESSTDAYLLDAGHIYRLDIATNQWAPVSSNLGSINSMVWLSPTTGYATVGKTVWRTTSGGHAWTVTFSAPVVGNHWHGQIVANSPNSVWFLVTGGVDGMSQTGFVLWHGTANGTQWTAITDEAYWAPTGYPSVHPAVSSSIMQPGDLLATGQHTVYLTGWNSNPSSHWVIFTNYSGRWTSHDISIKPTTPDFFMPPTMLSFSTSTTGFLAGKTELDKGAIMESTDGGATWHSLTSTG